MARQIRGDITIGNLEKKIGVPEGTFRHSNGRKMRKDKSLAALRKEVNNAKGQKKYCALALRYLCGKLESAKLYGQGTD